MRPAPLDRKALRDLWRMKWQLMAIALLIACGVSVAVMSFSAQRALARAQATFYEDTHFADVFAGLKRAPLSLTRELRAIDGVTDVDVRIVQGGLAQLPGLTRPATARLVSLPGDELAGLNQIRLVRGRLPGAGRADEVVALDTFMQAADLRLGQRLQTVIGGQARSFVIVGAALSPEYVYVPAPESFMPDDAHQAVLWARRDVVESASGMAGAFNAVAVKIAAGVPAAAVVADLDLLLSPYGGHSAYARADQPSHAFLDAELKELSTSAEILPPIFLVIAAALVHLVVTRLVEAEREQIGLLKAFGYTALQSARPYLLTASAVGLAGVLAGGLVGALLGASIVDLYRDYFRFPVLAVDFHWGAFAGASIAAVGSALAGSLMAVRRAAMLSPAVAMQPPRPAAFRRGLLDGVLGRADQASRMIVRHFQRFPSRALLAGLGLASSLSLLVGTQFLFDSLDQVVEQTYYRSQRWTESVGFQEVRSAAARETLRRLPGVIDAETVRLSPVRLKANGRQEVTRIVGLEPDAMLHRPLDAADRQIPFEGPGLVMSEALALRLQVKPGDAVWAEALQGRSVQWPAVVTAVSRDYSGFSAYMDRRELNRVLDEGDVISGAELLVSPDRRGEFYRAVTAIPQIIGASSRDETVAAWRQAMAEAFRVTITFYVGFAAAIAFGVAYNTMRISLSERARDLATLHVLGFGHWECAYILGGELLILALAALPVGLLGGEALAHGLVAAYSRDEVRLPAVIGPASFGVAVTAYLLAVVLGGLLVIPRIWRLDLVAVLKTRE